MIRNLSFLLFLSITTSLAAAPAITSISPASGDAAGGTAVTISGSGFTGATNVKFGSISVVPTVVNDSTITVLSPQTVPGAVNVVVTAGTDSPIVREDIYTYTGSWLDTVVFQSSQSRLTSTAVPSNAFVGQALLGFSSSDVAITPDAQYAITADGVTGMASVVSLATTTVVASIAVPGANLKSAVVTPDGSLVYLGDVAKSQTYIYSIPSFTVVPAGFIGQTPDFLMVSPDGTRLYVISQADNTIAVYNTSDQTLITTVGGLDIPTSMAIAPDGSKVYITSANSNIVDILDATTLTLDPSPINVGVFPTGIAVTSDGLTAYVVNNVSNDLYQIDLVTKNAVQVATGLSAPIAISLTPDDAVAYVLDASGGVGGTGQLVAIDLTTFVATPLSSFILAHNEAITPDQSPVAVFGFTGAGTSVITFDASASISPTGTITNYHWDFGDGTIVDTASPVIVHAYVLPNTYNVTLTVTNSAGTSTRQVLTGPTMSHNGNSFAIVSKSVNTGGVPPTPGKQARPKHFKGHLEKKKGDIILHTKWSKVDNAAWYQIFKHHKKIKTIKGKKSRHFNKHLDTIPYFKHHLGHLKKRLNRSYKIRAIGTNGVKSDFRRLKF